MTFTRSQAQPVVIVSRKIHVVRAGEATQAFLRLQSLLAQDAEKARDAWRVAELQTKVLDLEGELAKQRACVVAELQTKVRHLEYELDEQRKCTQDLRNELARVRALNDEAADVCELMESQDEEHTRQRAELEAHIESMKASHNAEIARLHGLIGTLRDELAMAPPAAPKQVDTNVPDSSPTLAQHSLLEQLRAQRGRRDRCANELLDAEGEREIELQHEEESVTQAVNNISDSLIEGGVALDCIWDVMNYDGKPG